MKIIAESAYNHMGDVNEVINLLHASKNSGADYFTVQIMDPISFSDVNYSKHQLYIDNNISYEEWDRVFEEGLKLQMPIIPCTLDEKTLKYVISKNIKLIKIHATDLTNPFMLDILAAHKDVKVILETQAATNFEIKYALDRIKNQVEALLTGYSNYPTEFEDLNLDSLDALRNDYGLKVGFADHSPTVVEIPLMAMAKGCAYLEKHITLSRNTRKFDWQVSLYPEEFQIMTASLNLYRKALGPGYKHPVSNEKPHRSVLYKKVLPDGSLKRADDAPDFITHEISTFSKEEVCVGIIARLKSQRLPKKVLAKLGSESVIEALYKNISKSEETRHIFLATSTLSEDDALVGHCEGFGLPIFRGHPLSVIDRLLEIAWKTKSGIVLRVTGDNPFTNPTLTDSLIKLLRENNLDYARANNVPFGVSAEVFSTSYLWRLYVNMHNPMVSEYLTWFVLEDRTAKKGCIDVETGRIELSLKNLSIDYPEDLEESRSLLHASGKSTVSELSLDEVLEYAVSLRDKKDDLMKLPGGTTILLSEYLNRWKNADFFKRESLRT